MGKYINRLGQVFGMLTVIGYQKSINRQKPNRICKCECGKETLKTDTYLINTKNPSCGCRFDKQTKVCASCKIEKDKSEYHLLRSKRSGVQSQ